MIDTLNNKSPVLILIALLVIFSASPLFAQNVNTNTTTNARNITVGTFTFDLPNDWREFSVTEIDQLRSQYLAQSKEIYHQYSGTQDPAISIDVAGFHIEGDAGAFIIVSFSIPPQSDLINLLRARAKINSHYTLLIVS